MSTESFPKTWRLYPLEQVMEAIIDYRGKTPTKMERGIPLITAKIVKNGYVQTPTEFIAEENYDTWMVRGLPEVGDVVLTTEAPLGETAQLTSSEVALAQRIVTLRGKKGVLDNDFLLCAMQSKYVQNQLEARATGSTVKGIKQSELRKVLIPTPPLEEQIKIAGTLKSLSDKISINIKTNQTLEHIAQAIFKSWFVDFDPVRAKIAVLEAGGTAEQAELAAMSAISAKDEAALKKLQAEQPEAYAELAKTAALFPSKMVDSELGGIPEGWEVTDFGSVSECFDRKRIPLSKRQREQKQGSVPYYGATSIMDFVDEAIFDDVFLLLGEDGSVLKEDGTPFVQYMWGPAWVNNHAHVLQGKNGVSTEQLMIFIASQNIAPYVTGAVQLKLNQKNMNSIPFIKATDNINVEFQSVVEPLYSSFRATCEQTLVLTAVRDTLLPRLLSGEIDIHGN